MWDGFLGPRFTADGPINAEDITRLRGAVIARPPRFFLRFIYFVPAAPYWTPAWPETQKADTR